MMISTNDEYRPAFSITIGNQELPQSLAENVQKINVTEEVGKLAKAVIHIRNWDCDQNQTDSDNSGSSVNISAGKSIQIQLGYASDLVEVFDGLVMQAKVSFDQGACSTLEINCRCAGVKLASVRRSQIWTDQSDFEAVSSICQGVGLSAEGNAGEQQPTIMQFRSSDWDFVLARAEAVGFQVYVRNSSLNFQKPNTSGDSLATLTWAKNLLDLEVSQDAMQVLDRVTAQAWDPDQKNVVTSTVQSSTADYATDGRPTVSAVLSGAQMTSNRELIVTETRPLSQGELKDIAQGIINQRSLGFYHGTGKCLGNANLRIDGLVEIAGVGTNYQGDYYLTKVNHLFSPEKFLTQFSVGAPLQANSPNKENNRPLIPPTESLVIATVESFADSDKKQGRVQVKLPWMDDNAEPIWARLATPAAGNGRGLVYIPEPEDEVLVAFLNNDPRFPIVVGALWNGQDAPPDIYDETNNYTRGIVSKSGHKVVLDDTDDKQQILVESQAGQQVLIDDTSGSESIQINDKTGNSLKMDSSGIAMNAASGLKISLNATNGTIELKADQIEATAQATAQISANTTASIQGTTKLDLQGAQVAMNGDAMIQAQAPLIKLN